MGLLIFSPNLLTLDAEYLHTNASRSRHAIWDEKRQKRGVSHDAIVRAWLGEHALREVRRQLVMDDEFAHDALNRTLVYALTWYATITYALCLQMSASQAMHVLIEVHHLESIELVGDRLNVDLLFRRYNLDAFVVPEHLMSVIHTP